MGKSGGPSSSSNPMQEHHRKQRQKQLQKNKNQRLKARNERVVQTKSVQDIQDDIKTLERRGKHLQKFDEQKLQRLKKELKLVQEAEKKARAEEAAQEEYHHHHQQQQQQQSQKPLTELDDPRKSVYFDERFNPYGAPPPGKPRLFHQRGGGVTMNILMAVVPGQVEINPPPPPPPPPPLPPPARPTNMGNYDHHRPPPIPPVSRHNTSLRKQPEKDSARESAHAFVGHNPSVSSKPLKTSSIGDDTHCTKKNSDNNHEDKPESGKEPPTVPSLPPPSKAVQRSARCRSTKAVYDIWASREEVDYERHNHIDLEADDLGTATKLKKSGKSTKKKKLPLEFHYQDRSGQVQGPFTKVQMKDWINAGFFPLDTMIKTSRNETWMPLGEVQSLQEQEVQRPSPAPSSQTLEERIAALKSDQQEENNPSEEDGEVSLQARIAAMKAHISQRKQQQQQQPIDTFGSQQHDRIAELREGTADHEQHTRQNPHYDGENEFTRHSDTAQNVNGSKSGVATYEASDIEGFDGGIAPYPVLDNDNDEAPPYYPVYEDDDGDGVAPYPVEGDEMHGVVAFNSNDDSQIGAVAPYPVTESYPSLEFYSDVGVAEGEGYSTARRNESSPHSPAGPSASHPKKTIKVDKEIVAFLPSHMQSKKRKAVATIMNASITLTAKKPKPESSPSKATSTKVRNNEDEDEYSKFMQEIDGLE